jgi:hypothetical protein
MINIDIITTDTITFIIPSWLAYTILLYIIADVLMDIILWIKRNKLKKLKKKKVEGMK